MSDEDDLVADMHDARWEVADALGDPFPNSLAEAVRRFRAERDRLLRVAEDAAGALDAMHGRLVLVIAERDRLRALVGKCYTATFLGIRPSGDHLSKTEQHTVPAVIQAALRCHVDKARAAEFERDGLRAVVDAAQRWRAAEPGHEASIAIQAMHEALDALDASDIKAGDDG